MSRRRASKATRSRPIVKNISSSSINIDFSDDDDIFDFKPTKKAKNNEQSVIQDSNTSNDEKPEGIKINDISEEELKEIEELKNAYLNSLTEYDVPIESPINEASRKTGFLAELEPKKLQIVGNFDDEWRTCKIEGDVESSISNVAKEKIPKRKSSYDSRFGPTIDKASIPKYAPKMFVSAKEYKEIYDKNEQHKPLSEEVFVNDFVVHLDREHIIGKDEPEIIVDNEQMNIEVINEESNEDLLNESIQELSEKIDLNASLSALSQILDTSDKISEYVKFASKSSEKVNSNKDLNISFTTQHYENEFINLIRTQLTQTDKTEAPNLDTQHFENEFINLIRTQPTQTDKTEAPNLDTQHFENEFLNNVMTQNTQVECETDLKTKEASNLSTQHYENEFMNVVMTQHTQAQSNIKDTNKNGNFVDNKPTNDKSESVNSLKQLQNDTWPWDWKKSFGALASPAPSPIKENVVVEEFRIPIAERFSRKKIVRASPAPRRDALEDEFDFENARKKFNKNKSGDLSFESTPKKFVGFNPFPSQQIDENYKEKICETELTEMKHCKEQGRLYVPDFNTLSGENLAKQAREAKKAKSKVLNEANRCTLSQRLREIDAFMMEDDVMTNSQWVGIQEEIKELAVVFKAEDEIKELRRQELQKQKEYIENKPAADIKPVLGKISKKKMDQSYLLSQIIADKTPVLLPWNYTFYTAVKVQKKKEIRTKQTVYINDFELKEEEIKKITYKDILNIKFDIKDVLNSKEDIFVSLGDNVKLVIGENFKVSFEEIKLAFLSSPGVDPKLLHEKWLQNAYTMIALKLIRKEKNFNPENILLELKYRYDCEIDSKKRSAIRQIVELDECAIKENSFTSDYIRANGLAECGDEKIETFKMINLPMVLNVQAITFIKKGVCHGEYELELSDGWYTIRVKVDKFIAEKLKAKNINVDTKLFISNAILLNSLNSCNPLDMPTTIMLKIFYNSTRVTNEEAELGACDDLLQYHIPLDAVRHNGGIIGKLKLFVTHVYPLVFKISKNRKRSKRNHRKKILINRIGSDDEVIYSELYSEAYEKALEEYRNSIKSKVERLKKKAFNCLSIKEICEIFEYERHESAFEFKLYNSLSAQQIKEVKVYEEALKVKYKKWTLERMEKIEKTKVPSLLRFRVVDECMPNKTAVVNWIEPPENVLEVIQAGKIVEISDAIAWGQNHEILIFGSNEVASTETNSHEKYQKYRRKETKINELKDRDFQTANDEIDLSAMIIRIVHKDHDGYQQIYVVDDEKNFMIIKFTPSIPEVAYDDFIKPGQLLFFRNLTYYQSEYNVKCSDIREAYVTMDSTIFTKNPKDDEYRLRLDEFNERISDGYFKECCELIEKLVPTKLGFKLSLKDCQKVTKMLIAKGYKFRQHGKICAPRKYYFK